MSETTVRSVRGMNDLLPADSGVFAWIEAEMRRVFSLHGFSELRTPIVEETRLFSRAVGEETDIVSKEMYTFSDRDGTSLTLRPEGTASAVRAYIEHGLDRTDPVARWFYTGPMFRHERPQKGRYRQFHQIGAEVFGLSDAHVDAELIHMLARFARHLGVKGVSLKVNSLGCTACRPAYREALKGYIDGVRGSLCEDCLRRAETNPLRVLDCKQEGCIAATANAPSSADHLCAECAAHFNRVKAGLDALGESWETDNRMVRGLDYYNRTTFELLATDPSSGVGSQNAIAGGGRYDGLVEMLGGRPTPAVGFAIGVERLRMLVDPGLAAAAVPGVFVMTGGKGTLQAASRLAVDLRTAGIPVEFDGSEKGFKAKFKRADKCGAALTVIVGEDEAARGACSIKSMTEAMLPGGQKQIESPLIGAVQLIRSILGR